MFVLKTSLLGYLIQFVQKNMPFRTYLDEYASLGFLKTQKRKDDFHNQIEIMLFGLKKWSMLGLYVENHYPNK